MDNNSNKEIYALVVSQPSNDCDDAVSVKTSTGTRWHYSSNGDVPREVIAASLSTLGGNGVVVYRYYFSKSSSIEPYIARFASIEDFLNDKPIETAQESIDRGCEDVKAGRMRPLDPSWLED